MSFLAPWFLVGALAVGMPILFHLIRRTIREKQPFSSLMFLLPTPPRITRQSRLENLLLLLFRCLVIGLLALAFARPFIQKPIANDPASDSARQRVVLIDISASMRREDLWAQAVGRAEQVIASSAPGDIVALSTYDRATHPVVTLEQSKTLSPTERRNTLRQALSTLKPGWGNAHLGSALLGVSEGFDTSGTGVDSRPGMHQIILISDLADGSSLAGLQGHEWPKGLEVLPQPVRVKHPTNVGLMLLPEHGDEESRDGTALRFRVTNSSDAQREQFRLRVQGGASNTPPILDLYVPPGQTRVLSARIASGKVAELRLEGDDADFDNTVRWLPPLQERVTILYLGNDAEADPNQSAYYLQRAFTSTRHRALELRVRKPTEALAASDLADVSLIIASSERPTATASSLLMAIESGRTLLLSLPNASAETRSGLGTLLNSGGVRLSEALKRNFSLFGQIDFTHPLFTPFADARFNDFTKIHFWKHRLLLAEGLPPTTRIVASFDDESPALLEIGIGKGSVLILTAGWQPADGQLALSTKFVPLLYSILERSRPSGSSLDQFFVGDALPLSGQTTNGLRTVRKPDGSEIKVDAQPNFSGTDIPGIYTLLESGVRMAVNVPPEESRTTPLTLDQLEKLGLPLEKHVDPKVAELSKEQKRVLASVELEGRQKLWRWLIVAGFLFVILETWLAGRLVQPRTADPLPSTP